MEKIVMIVEKSRNYYGAYAENGDGISPIVGGRQAAAGKAYNMQGVCVGRATDTLAKGVYIIDGKKVVIE